MDRSTLRRAVVLACALGAVGAATGTAHAWWADEVAVPGDTVRSGSMLLTVGGQVTADLPPVADVKANHERVVPITIEHASPVGARNLRMAVTLVAIDHPNELMDLSFGVAAQSPGDACTTDLGFIPVQPNTTADVPIASSLAPSEEVQVCLWLRMAPPSPPKSSGSSLVTLTFSGHQVRP